MYFGSDENLAGAGSGQADRRGGRQEAAVRHPGSRVGGAGGALRRREEGRSRTRRTSRSTVPTTRRWSSSLQAKLAQDKSIDYIVTLGAPIALDAMKAMDAGQQHGEDGHLRSEPDAAQAIKDGKIQFSIDQQPYVQGYLAVTSLYLNIKNGNDIGGGKAVLTGPSFVDAQQHRQDPARSRRTTPASRLPRVPARLGRRPAARSHLIGEFHESNTQDPRRPARRRRRRTGSSSVCRTGCWPARRSGPLSRPIVILIFFLIVAPAFRSPESFFTVLYQSSTIGIVAVAVGMLMIGGEFDLSAGVHGHHRRAVQRHVLLLPRHQPVGRCARVAGLLPGHRVRQRLSGDANRDPVAS